MTVDGRRRPCQLLRRLFGMPVRGRTRSRAEATSREPCPFIVIFLLTPENSPLLADIFPVT